MGISKYNAEGYKDPTAYEAFLRIDAEEKRKRAAHIAEEAIAKAKKKKASVCIKKEAASCK